MAFNADDRVRVTSQNSVHRKQLGTVEIAAADSADGFNKVRIDGHQVGTTVNLADNELVITNFAAPVTYP